MFKQRHLNLKNTWTVTKKILEGIAWDALLILVLSLIYVIIRIVSDDLAFLLTEFPALSEGSSLAEITLGGQIANTVLKKLVLLWSFSFIAFIASWILIKYLLYRRLLNKPWSFKELRVFALQTIIYWTGMGVLVAIFRVALLPFYDSLSYPLNFITYSVAMLITVSATLILGTSFLLSNAPTIKETFKNYKKIRLIKQANHWCVVAGLVITNVVGYFTTSYGLSTGFANILMLVYLSWVRVYYAQALEKVTRAKRVASKQKVSKQKKRRVN
jgi:hypothetical protein